MNRRNRITLMMLAFCVLFGVACHATSPTPLEIDSNGDHRIDTWVFYGEAGRLTRLEKDQNGDGRADWRDDYAFDPALKHERLVRSQTDLDNDDFFETTVYHDHPGNAARIERDRNGDGKIDLTAFEDWDHPERRVVRRDDDYDGVFEQTGPGLSLL